jgi:4-oxalocrotonate tautomerase
VLKKDPHLTHIVIEEVDTDNWGYAGITTTQYRKQLAEKEGKS